MINILVVCTANICRSPAASLFLSEALCDVDANIESAGVFAIDGNVIDPIVAMLMGKRGFTGVTSHRSRLILPSHLTKYNLILCMERMHVSALKSMNPICSGKTMLLGHWNGGMEVDDPTGKSLDDYSSSLDAMHNFCIQWAAKIALLGLGA